MLSYLSFEIVEDMLYKMKTLNLTKIQKEFIMLTIFHGEEFRQKLDMLPFKQEVKETMQAQIDEFLAGLLELSKFEQPDLTSEQ